MDIDFAGGFTSAWYSIANTVPNILVFIVILLVGWLIAALLARATDALLERVGFDRAVERGGIRSALAHTKYDASDFVAKLVYYAVLLFALTMAFNVFGPNPVSDLLASIVAWLPKLAVAIVIIVVAAAIAAAVRDIVIGALSALSYGRVIGNLVFAFIWGLGIIAALDQIGVATSVTTPILIAVLATIGGVIVVGVGGGLVRPMQERWSRWLHRAEEDTAAVREASSAVPGASAASRRSTVDPNRPSTARPPTADESLQADDYDRMRRRP